MLKLVPIFLLLFVAMAVWTVRHRDAVIPWHDRTALRDEPTDVAAQLRKLAGTSEPHDKQWAQRFDEFVNAHPGRQWVVGRCDRPGLSEQEAAESAYSDAAEQLYPIVLRQTNATRVDRGWLRTRLGHDITDGRLDADRCAEQFTRPYGKVWAESVLLDVSPDRLDPMVASYSSELRHRHAGQTRNAILASGLVISTLLGYVLLNHLTRGYFATRLRIAATVIAAAGILLLV
jgi:hypothetical protein